MAGTKKGNRKIAARLKDKYGVDENGKSVFHVQVGAKGGQKAAGVFFKTLQRDDPERLAAIGRAGGKIKKTTEGKHETDSTERSSDS